MEAVPAIPRSDRSRVGDYKINRIRISAILLLQDVRFCHRYCLRYLKTKVNRKLPICMHVYGRECGDMIGVVKRGSHNYMQAETRCTLACDLTYAVVVANCRVLCISGRFRRVVGKWVKMVGRRTWSIGVYICSIMSNVMSVRAYSLRDCGYKFTSWSIFI